MDVAGLKMNTEKTQLIWLGSRQHLAKLTVSQLEICSSAVVMVTKATNLGVVLDDQIIMAPYSPSVCHSQLWGFPAVSSEVISTASDA